MQVKGFGNMFLENIKFKKIDLSDYNPQAGVFQRFMLFASLVVLAATVYGQFLIFRRAGRRRFRNGVGFRLNQSISVFDSEN
jgi:hypothetical protein